MSGRQGNELMVVDALVQAIDRRDEVFQVIEDSEDVDEAIRRVGQLLGVDHLGGRVVLDLQARRLTRDQRLFSRLPVQKNLDPCCRMGAEPVA